MFSSSIFVKSSKPVIWIEAFVMVTLSFRRTSVIIITSGLKIIILHNTLAFSFPHLSIIT